MSPVSSSLLRWLPLALIALVACWLRTRDLDRRPMHFDEANQAVKLGELLDQGHYAFDPKDHHGPTLYFAGVPMARLRGERSLAQLTETTVRLVPAVFGTLTVVLIALLAAPLGRWPALVVAALVALSPPSVYYSRYFIQETLLVTFTLAAFLSAAKWWQTGLTRWALALGICLGLMQATKASAPLFLGAALLAWWLARERKRAPVTRRPRRDIAFALGAAVFTAALLYSSFGTQLSGLRDALSTYAHAATRFGAEAPPTGHEKPWWYYLSLFGWVKRGGFAWEQLGFSLLALAGVALAIGRSRLAGDGPRGRSPQSPASRLLQGAAIYTVVVFGTLSVFSYKTPWHVVHFVPGMALLAAGALAALTHLRTGRLVAIPIAIFVLGMLWRQTQLVAFLRPADQRNPYAYVHSSPDVLKVRPLAEAALARHANQPIRVIAEEVWPLPWYLRGLPRVGFWAAPPENCDGALIIASTTQADAVRAKLRERYRESFLGLRPGVIVILFTKEEGNETKGNEGVRE